MPRHQEPDIRKLNHWIKLASLEIGEEMSKTDQLKLFKEAYQNADGRSRPRLARKIISLLQAIAAEAQEAERARSFCIAHASCSGGLSPDEPCCSGCPQAWVFQASARKCLPEVQ